VQPTRREALILLAALAASGCARRGETAGPVPAMVAMRLDATESHAIGKAWLARRSSESADALAKRVLGEGAPATPSALWAHVRDRVRADFGAGRTERLQGWLLSETELALYGFIALTTSP
jgi:hypothetical protein